VVARRRSGIESRETTRKTTGRRRDRRELRDDEEDDRICARLTRVRMIDDAWCRICKEDEGGKQGSTAILIIRNKESGSEDWLPYFDRQRGTTIEATIHHRVGNKSQ